MNEPSFTEPQQVEAQARLAAIVESSDDAIVSKTLEGIVTSWNKGAERIFGYTADEMRGRPINVLFPADRQQEEPQILARLHRGERVDHFETIRMTKDGRLVEVSVTISPVRDATGRIVGASKIARDITAQKQAERDLRSARDAAEAARRDAEEARRSAEAARAQAEQASRAKDHFMSVLSHELRTPLTPVLAAVSLIEASHGLPADEIRGHVAMIRRNVETQARLVDDLLDITLIARGKVRLRFEVVDAHAAVRNVVAMLQGDIDAKGLAVTLALRARDRHVWADPGRFQQIVLNLLSNALKFTPENGAIAFRTANDDEHGLKVEVMDTGIGIEADVLPRLFQAFEQGERTVTRKFGGLGLGLSIVRSLIDLHGGSVTAASPGPGAGATFAFRLETVPPTPAPAKDADADPATPAAAGVAARPPKSFRVLLVEDHDDTRRLLGKLLGSFGCQVTAAATVRQAVDLADREDFDLLLSDIGLPDGTGLDVMRHVAERRKIRGIALSGFGQEDDLRRSREAGFEQHLIKPINLQTLREAILHAGV